MKKLILAFMLLAAIKSNSQCFNGFCVSKHGEGALVTANVIVDNSFKYFQPSGFSGIGVHAGVWAGTLGATIGWVDSRVSYDRFATRNVTFTMMAKAKFFNEKVQAVPFFSVGSKNYQDIGLRVGYKIYQGIYLGAMVSYTMHYGLSLVVSVEK